MVHDARLTSWMIIERATRKVICETFKPVVVSSINISKYEAVPILQYLQSLNMPLPRPKATAKLDA